ncbi:MAG: glycosyltransferase family 92 protein [Ignavibacteriales bacterium]|nr:glycosyltransferase family 92 protein [Ignavibacteriales bacterium]
MYNLIACAVSKCEGKYIKDWIDWHKKLGVEKFVIYDEGSDHETLEVLQRDCWSGLVEYMPTTTHPVQYQAYTNCIQRYTGKADWILFLDIDEFINPFGLDNYDLRNLLVKFNHPNIGGVAFPWHCFGTSDSNKYEDRAVWKRITKRIHYEDPNCGHSKHIKSIMRPQCVSNIDDPHWFKTKPGFHTVDMLYRPITISEHRNNYLPMDKVVINHYITKTKEEWFNKVTRGSADYTQDSPRAKKLEQFEPHVKACTYDDRTIFTVAKKLGFDV